MATETSMEIEKIAAKLRPMMPEKINHWMKARQLADAELRSLIEKQIISTAYQVFGDFGSKILLSLPPERIAKGSIELGTVLYDSERWPFGLRYDELIQNAAILGRSGAGKTNVTFHILDQLISKDIPFIYLDWKRTARHHLLVKYPGKVNTYTPGREIARFPFNPFVVPPGIETNVYVNQIIDIMSQAFTLGDGAKSIIRKALASMYKQGNLCPTAAQIIAQIQTAPTSGRMTGWKMTAMRALASLEFSDLSSTDSISQESLTEKLLHSNTVIELDGLDQESKKFLVPILALWLYYVRLKSPDREKLKLVLFIEEAHHVLHKRAQTAGETVLEMLLRQCRELGLAIVVVDQHPHLLSSAALGNSYTTIFLNQKDPSDISKAAAVCQLDGSEKEAFSMLSVGQAIVKLQDRWPRPFLVKIPLIDVNKGSVTDAMLARYFSEMSSKAAGSGRNSSVGSYFRQIRQVRLYDIPLNLSQLAFLKDISANCSDGVKTRYKRLGLSTWAGNNMKQQLIDQGWIESQTVELGCTRKVCLRLTDKAREALGQNGPARHGSIAHEYWKMFYAQRFDELGYGVQLEVPRISGCTDVVAKKGDNRIAIEIETGKSDFLRNIRQNLSAGYDKIFVIATGKSAFEKIERVLAKEGLMIPDRIELSIGADFSFPNANRKFSPAN